MKLSGFLKKFSPQLPVFLGLELDHQSMRLVQMAKVDQTLLLHSYQQIVFPQRCLSERFSWNHPEFPDFLKQHIQQTELITRQVVLALPDQSVLFKTIELDKTLHAAEIATQVRSRAEVYFNYPLHELMLDFELLGESKCQPALREVRWVAARRSEVELRINALNHAGLTAAAIEVDSYALARAAVLFVENQQPQSVMTAVIHLSEPNLLLVVIQQGRIIYSRAENYASSASASLSAITLAVTQALTLFLNNTALANLSSILLAGSPITAALLASVEERTGISTQCLDVWSWLKSSSTVADEPKKYLAHEFAMVTGLAMRVADEY